MLDLMVTINIFFIQSMRIADIIVRAPDGDISEYKLPEVARVYDGEIIIEPYLPNK